MKSSLQAIFNNSRIWTYLKGPDHSQTLWSKSGFYKLLDLAINSPLNGISKLYHKHETLFSSSLTFKLIRLLSDKFYYIIGLFLILNMIVPDHKWYNIYGVILSMLLFILFLVKVVINPEERVNFESIDYAIIIFFISILIASLTSIYPRDSINYLIYYFITFLTLIVFVSSINTYDDLNIVIKLILIGTFLTAIYGVYQWKIIGIEVNPSLTDLTINQGMGGRVYSTMGNPNVYGELLVLTMPFFGALILNEKSILKKIIWSILLIPVIIILFKTGSRSSWVAFAISMFIFVFFWNKKLVPFLILIGIVSLPFLPSSIYNRLLTIFNPNDTSLKYRKQILGPAMAMLKDFWLTGVGLGTRVVGLIYQRYKSFGLTTVAHTHNLYIQLWLEAGIVAIVSFILIILRLVRNTFVVVHAKKYPKVNNILIASLSAILGLIVMGFADHIWFYNRIMFMFWINIAIVLVSLKLIKKEKIEQV